MLNHFKNSDLVKCFLALFWVMFSQCNAGEVFDAYYVRTSVDVSIAGCEGGVEEKGVISFRFDPYNELKQLRGSYVVAVYIRPMAFSDKGVECRSQDVPRVSVSLGRVERILKVDGEMREDGSRDYGRYVAWVVFKEMLPERFTLEYTMPVLKICTGDLLVYNILESKELVPPYFYGDERYKVSVAVSGYRATCDLPFSASHFSDDTFVFRDRNMLTLKLTRETNIDGQFRRGQGATHKQ